MENAEVISQDLITNDIYPYFQYSHATQGQRFLNFFIDNVLMRLVLTYATGFVVGKILMLLSPELMLNIINYKDKIGLYALAYIVIIFNYLVYYTLCENLLRGKTIGKFFTETKAMRVDGKELAFKDALLRSLCRLIPFEIFSGFSIAWHNSLTNTMVVKTR